MKKKLEIRITPREKEIIDKTIDVLSRYLNSQEIWIFGSRAKQKATHGSDFDFAVDGARPDVNVTRKIAEEMDKFLGLYQADIIYLGDAKKDFKEIVYSTGKKIYERI